MADFTPGPWEAGPNPQGLYSNDWVVRPAGEFPHGEWIADVGGGTTDPVRRANAHLISAAPDMYKVLKALHNSYFQDSSEAFHETMSDFMFTASQAIAKAEAH
jgi:hypothetical protein